jgi:CRISPR/Cas system-associated exonuclease Cas4 (RecB family)
MWELFTQFVSVFKNFQEIWLVLIVFFTVYLLLINHRRGRIFVPENAKLIWVDKGKNTEPFFNKAYRVFGKPDALYDLQGNVIAVEFKSRKVKVYDADRIQALTAALATRGAGYDVRQVVVKSSTDIERINLPEKDKALYELVKKDIEAARAIKSGHQAIAKPESTKCPACAYNNHCGEKTI